MSKPQTIIRATHDSDNPYFMMRRDTAQDRELSWEARGILAYLLSQSDEWEIQIKDLQQQCGKNRVYRIIDELKEARYIEDRKKYQNPDTGQWEWTPYRLHERPYPQNHDMETRTWKPEHGNGEILEKKKEKEQIDTIEPLNANDFQEKLSLLRDNGFLTPNDFDKFKVDADEYTLDLWQEGVNRTIEQRNRDGKHKGYKYLLSVMASVEAERKQAALDAKPKQRTVYTIDEPLQRPTLESSYMPRRDSV